MNNERKTLNDARIELTAAGYYVETEYEGVYPRYLAARKRPFNMPYRMAVLPAAPGMDYDQWTVSAYSVRKLMRKRK